MGYAKRAAEVPLSSTRRIFCLVTVGSGGTDPNATKNRDRRRMLSVLEAANATGKEICSVSGTRGQSYRDELLDSVFALCPFGAATETHRLWEVVLAGALVISTHAAFIEVELQAPFLLLDSWQDLSSTLEAYKGQPEKLDELQRIQQDWFTQYMQRKRVQVRYVTAASFKKS